MENRQKPMREMVGRDHGGREGGKWVDLGYIQGVQFSTTLGDVSKLG